jgi:hypothetical protein
MPDRVPKTWLIQCCLLVLPLTALIHYALLSHRCMLNLFGDDYNPATLWLLFRSDPSLPWAIVILVVVYRLGKPSPGLRRIAAPAFLASLPLTVWLWDIPGTGRYICHHFHDGRVIPMLGFALSTKYVAAFCLFLYVVFQAVLSMKRTRMPARAAARA